jgi:hypothetical protein
MKKYSFLCYGGQNYRRKYKIKDEGGLIKQIESDKELYSGLEKQDFVKSHVVEIRYSGSGKADGKTQVGLKAIDYTPA